MKCLNCFPIAVDCTNVYCTRIKTRFRHAEKCSRRDIGGCPGCKQLIKVCYNHSNECEEPDCQVKYCQYIKTTIQCFLKDNFACNFCEYAKENILTRMAATGKLKIVQLLAKHGITKLRICSLEKCVNEKSSKEMLLLLSQMSIENHRKIATRFLNNPELQQHFGYDFVKRLTNPLSLQALTRISVRDGQYSSLCGNYVTFHIKKYMYFED